MVVALTARSRSASRSTISGSLPPSSRLTGVSVSAARFITTLPVRSEPVNWTKSTSSTSAPPVSPMPLTTSRTSGPPISSFHARTSSMVESGVNSEGLMTTAQPGDERRDRVVEGEDEREVPGADHADHRVGAVDDAQPLHLQGQDVRRRRLLGEELAGVLAVVVDRAARNGASSSASARTLPVSSCITSASRS